MEPGRSRTFDVGFLFRAISIIKDSGNGDLMVFLKQNDTDALKAKVWETFTRNVDERVVGQLGSCFHIAENLGDKFI